MGAPLLFCDNNPQSVKNENHHPIVSNQLLKWKENEKLTIYCKFKSMVNPNTKIKYIVIGTLIRPFNVR